MFLSTDKTDQMVNEELPTGDKTLNSEPSITLWGMGIDNLLRSDKHIANLCKHVASKLNVLKRLSRSMGHTERKHASVYSLEFQLLCTDMAFLQ